MKRITLLLFFLILVSFGIYAFIKIKMGAITGQVTPIESVNMVMLISGLDTIKVQPVQGVFRFNNLKQGVYSLIIKGSSTYRDLLLKNVAVKDSSTTNVGRIIVQQ